MSLLGKIVVFALKEIASPALSKCGEHLGDAAGKVLGRKIDPTHAPPETKDDDDDK